MDPIDRFTLWYAAAVHRSPGRWFDASAMTLATAGKSGDVTARMVLLKKFGPEGFLFYTNYSSRKGVQLLENPRAALVFYWPYLRRQVRIEGTVELTSREDSDSYFHSRPREYQLAASVSKQSETIPSRRFLLDKFNQLERRFRDESIPLPTTWGGYRLIPGVFEFWRHRDNRLHDRIRYRRTEESKWICERLAP
jgi:pyridoxamine 5'-phosphate oxidase